MTSKTRSLTLISKSLVAALALTAFAGCAEESPKLKGFQSAEKITTTEAANFNPKVDILFVIDDSGSMGTQQASLAANIPKFIAEIEKSSILDYHIGLTTSSFDGYSRSGCSSGTYACGGGVLHGGVSKTPFVTRKTPNGLKILAENMIVGTSGSATERFFAPVVAALSAPLVNTDNAGFYRQDATLVVIFITDAEDQSNNMKAADYLKFVWGLKNDDTKKVLNYGAIIPVGRATGPGCYRDDGDSGQPIELTEAIVKTNGSFFDLCGSDYGTELGLVASDVAQKVSKVLYLNRAPDPKSITVRYGTQVIPEDRLKGWWLDIRRNALVFGDELELTVQPEGTNLEVNFNAAGYEMK